MRKVKLLTSRVNNLGQPEQWGDMIDLPEQAAERLIAAGQAMPVADERTAASPDRKHNRR